MNIFSSQLKGHVPWISLQIFNRFAFSKHCAQCGISRFEDADSVVIEKARSGFPAPRELIGYAIYVNGSDADPVDVVLAFLKEPFAVRNNEVVPKTAIRLLHVLRMEIAAGIFFPEFRTRYDPLLDHLSRM